MSADQDELMTSAPLCAIGAHYHRRDLRGADLQGAILAHAVFRQVDLRGADLIGANLTHAQFIECDLRGALLSYARLHKARMIGCRLTGCHLQGAELSSVHITPRHGSRDQEHIAVERSSARPPKRRFVCVDGMIYSTFEWSGSRSCSTRPIILLHGMTGHALDFEPLVSRIDRPVFAVQLIGHGSTAYRALEDELFDDPSELPETLSYLELVDQLIKVITLLSSEGEVDLLGYSMGGRLALHLAVELASRGASAPWMIRHLSVIGASLGIRDEQSRASRQQRDQEWADSLWAQPDTEAFLKLWNQQPLLARLASVNPREAARVQLHRLEHDPRGLAMAFSCLGQGEMPPLDDTLSSVTHPITMIYGEEDVKYKQIAQEAERVHVCVSAVEIEGTGHAPHLEDLDAFWRHVGCLISDADGH